jgi:hypothetical protein
METAASVLRLREDIRARFPSDAEWVDARVEGLGYEADACTAWFEQFSQRTTKAMRARDESTVRAHLSFMSGRLATADAAVLEYIDVYYVETLMGDLDVRSKRWAWSLMPSNLRGLYVAMWGEPRF